MKLRGRLALVVLVTTAPLVAGAVLAMNEVWDRFTIYTLRDVVRFRMENGGREECEKSPETFVLPRPVASERAAAESGGTAPEFGHLAPRLLLPAAQRAEIYAYPGTFASANPNAPAFPSRLRAALEAGADHAELFDGEGSRQTLQLALRMPWREGPCAVVLALPGSTRRRYARCTIWSSGRPSSGSDWWRPSSSPPDRRSHGSARSPQLSAVRAKTRGESRSRRAARMRSPIWRARVQRRRRRGPDARRGPGAARADPPRIRREHRPRPDHAAHRAARPAHRHAPAPRGRRRGGRGVRPRSGGRPTTWRRSSGISASRLGSRRASPTSRAPVDRTPSSRASSTGTVHRIVRACRAGFAVPEEVLFVDGDETLLEQAASNRSQCRPPPCAGGHVAVTLETPASGRQLRLSVSDDGPGLSEADRVTLSAREAPSESARPRGTERGGLGLRIVRKIVEKHKMNFELRPREGGSLVAEIRGSIRNAGGGGPRDGA
jgi:hypothetical protein